MSYKEALNKATAKRIVGVVIAILSLITLTISLLKFLYFRLDDGSKFGGAIATPFKRMVYYIYENTQFLSWFWEFSPTPDQMNLAHSGNFYFLIAYVFLFVGLAINGSGIKLSRRLFKIKQQIEDQLIKESIKGKKARTREDIENEINIPNPSIFLQVHQLYIAPIVTAIIAGILLKLFGY